MTENSTPFPFRRVCRLGAGLTLALVFGLAGCSDKDTAKPYTGTVYPVKGSVQLANGKPLTGGKVIFMPKALGESSASGEIGSDGTFSLKTSDSREGAAPGEYKVRIEPALIPSATPKSGVGVNLKALPFPVQYADEDGDTGLTATVKPESNQLEPFKLVAVKSKKAERNRD